MAEPALVLDNVRAGYGETVVLEDIRFNLGASETVSIIGRNGVGKTTLLATIMGHTALHGGRLSLLHPGNLCLLPHLGGKVTDDQGNEEHHNKGDDILRVVYGKGEAGGDKKEIKGQDA